MRYRLALRLLKSTSPSGSVGLEELSNQLQIPVKSVRELLATQYPSNLFSLTAGNVLMDPTQRLSLTEHLLRSGHDPRPILRCILWQEFELLTVRCLELNGFSMVRHVAFKTSTGRREIDVLAWTGTQMLAIDCKLWRRGLSAAKLHRAVMAQIERATALANRPDLMAKLGVDDPARRAILPVILVTGETARRFIEDVPIVPFSSFPSFLEHILMYHDPLCLVKVKAQPCSSSLQSA